LAASERQSAGAKEAERPESQLIAGFACTKLLDWSKYNGGYLREILQNNQSKTSFQLARVVGFNPGLPKLHRRQNLLAMSPSTNLRPTQKGT
jgi:hypothetical protein